MVVIRKYIFKKYIFYITNAPMIAPVHWKKIVIAHCKILIFLKKRRHKVRAGLFWAPVCYIPKAVAKAMNAAIEY